MVFGDDSKLLFFVLNVALPSSSEYEVNDNYFAYLSD